jgi:hypothetical protein
MKHIFPPLVLLVVAGCAATPRPVDTPARVVPAAVTRERGDLIGLDANALVERFGSPRLQVREGDGTKLQFAAGSCLLDAYLYPATGGGVPRTAHVDTRGRDGRSMDQAGCIALLDAR